MSKLDSLGEMISDEFGLSYQVIFFLHNTLDVQGEVDAEFSISMTLLRLA